jgi:diketogulonate reductase-like aldo/keto reductase
VTQICLAWLLAQRDITGVIAGASSADQVQSIARASDIKLAPNDLRSIDEGFAQVKIDKNAGLSWSGRTRNLVRRAGGKIKRSLGLT